MSRIAIDADKLTTHLCVSERVLLGNRKERKGSEGGHR